MQGQPHTTSLIAYIQTVLEESHITFACTHWLCRENFPPLWKHTLTAQATSCILVTFNNHILTVKESKTIYQICKCKDIHNVQTKPHTTLEPHTDHTIKTTYHICKHMQVPLYSTCKHLLLMEYRNKNTTQIRNRITRKRTTDGWVSRSFNHR